MDARKFSSTVCDIDFPFHNRISGYRVMRGKRRFVAREIRLHPTAGHQRIRHLDLSPDTGGQSIPPISDGEKLAIIGTIARKLREYLCVTACADRYGVAT